MRIELKLGGAKVLALAIGLTAAQASAQEISWDMPNEYGENTITGRADSLFAERLKENSDGRIEVTNHFGGSLGFRSVDHWSAVEDGAVPLASTYVGVFTGIDPIFLLTSMPFLATNPIEAKALIDAAWPHYEAAFAEGGQILLFTEPWVPGGIWAAKPITEPEDLEGLQVRTFDSNGTHVMAEVGANPVQMSWSDVVPALATGAIDSVLTGGSPGLAAGFHEHITYYHEIGFVMGSSMVHMNRSAFESLPEDLQTIVMDTAKEVEEEVWANVREELKGDFQRMEEAGVTVYPEPGEELLSVLQEASSPLLDEWKEKMPNGVGDEILAQYQELLAERR
jgi:TRAP-type transport system periplasmic protein